MRPRKDSTGSVLDISESYQDRFLDLLASLREKDSKIDFIAERCLTLPEIIEEGDVHNNWRSGG